MSDVLNVKITTKMDAKTEIRKLSPGSLFKLVQILEYDESWKRLMAIIPKTLDLETFEAKIAINNFPKYNTEHFKLIENAGCKFKRACSEILFDEWGTSGRVRPRLGHLLRLLERAELYRAADYVAVELLNVPAPTRPESGPAAKIDITLSDTISAPGGTASTIDIERILDEINYPSSILNNITNTTSQENTFNRNIDKPKLIIPKIIVNEVNVNTIESNTENIQEQSPNNSSNSNNNTSDNTTSLTWREQQLEKKIEKYAPPLLENQVSDCPVSDMMKFSSDQLPAFSSLLNHENVSSTHETHNYNIPNISQLISQQENDENNVLPALSQIFGVSSQNINNFHSTSEENQNIPSFNQLLSSQHDVINNSNNNEMFMPPLSSLLNHNTNYEINETSAEMPNNIPEISIPSNDFIIPKLSMLQSITSDISELTIPTRKTSLSPVNSSRTTCASPLPNLSLNTLLPHFTYTELEQCTDFFDETPYKTFNSESKGRKLGSGAFGSVYLGIGLLNKLVAVKKLNLNGVIVVNIDDTITKQFKNEVELLCKYKHENLLSLLGYSCDGPTYCLIYEYIPGGALKDRLQSIENRLIWTNRIYIALGTAKAVSYLHTAYSMPLIHRDIKSANILLDNSNKSKLCDFGLIKLTPNQNTNTSTTVFGTSAYMAPEAFRGDVSVKLDTFSFGVVLLELLTGLPPLDENREGNDLVTHVEDICEDGIKPLLDYKAGSWSLKEEHFGEDLYKIAVQCLEEKKKRPVMPDVVQQLSQLIDKTL